MKIKGKEIIASENKYIHRKDSDIYFKRCTLLKNETIDNFEEIDSLPDDEIEIIRKTKLDEIEVYDKSINVNEFFINEESIWLDKDTRVGLVNSTNAEISKGHENTILWNGTTKYTIPCNAALTMLQTLEIYALECFNKTAEHKANIMKLNTKEAIELYDYRVGYPEKLKFEI